MAGARLPLADGLLPVGCCLLLQLLNQLLEVLRKLHRTETGIGLHVLNGGGLIEVANGTGERDTSRGAS